MSVGITGKGYEEIASNQTLFENYVQAMTEGCSANSKAQIAQLMENTNKGILQESSVSGIAPIASLSMPVIRKLWPMFALKEAIKTEVANTPRFVVSYTKPYLQKAGGEKIYLPQGLMDSNGALSAAGKKETKTATATLAAAGSATVEFVAGEKIALDRDFYLTSVKVGGEEKLDLPVQIDINNNIITTVGEGAEAIQVVVKADLANGTALVIATGAAVIGLEAGIDTEWNEDAFSTGFDIERKDIQIPTGQHITAPLAIEALNDMQAMYQIDGTKEATDLMTQVFSQKLDLDVIAFLENSLKNRPGSIFGNYGNAASVTAAFDCNPQVGFAGGPKAWREEIKPLIDTIATRIKNETYLNNGIFTIIGNPIDTNVISNIDWQFRGGQASVDGVDVDYSIGTYVGANVYKVISSVNVKEGALYIVFTPSSDKQMTYKYYPYTFSVEVGYRDPNHPMVPALMMTKRHTFAEYIPAIGCVEIKNANGTYFSTAAKNYYGE
jgi:hypothetical protein